MPAYVTVQELERHLQIDFGNDNDAAILQYLDGAEAAILEFCDHPGFLDTTYSNELYTGEPDMIDLYLRAWPINSVTTLIENGNTLVEGTDFIIENAQRGQLRRIVSGSDPKRPARWSTYLQAIDVTYDAGYGAAEANLPKDLKNIILRVAGREFMAYASSAATGKSGGWGVQSVSLSGSDSVTFRDTILRPDEVAIRLTASEKAELVSTGYKRRRIFL